MWHRILSVPKTILLFYLIAFVVVAVLGWCSWQLHQYHHKFMLLDTASKALLKKDRNTISPAHLQTLKVSIEQQLTCASSADINFVTRFKNETDYPQNVLAQTLKTIQLMQGQLADVTDSDSIVSYTIMVGGKNHFFVSFQFLKQGDTLQLTGIQNICPLFTKVRCFEEQKANPHTAP